MDAAAAAPPASADAWPAALAGVAAAHASYAEQLAPAFAQASAQLDRCAAALEEVQRELVAGGDAPALALRAAAALADAPECVPLPTTCSPLCLPACMPSPPASSLHRPHIPSLSFISHASDARCSNALSRGRADSPPAFAS